MHSGSTYGTHIGGDPLYLILVYIFTSHTLSFLMYRYSTQLQEYQICTYLMDGWILDVSGSGKKKRKHKKKKHKRYSVCLLNSHYLTGINSLCVLSYVADEDDYTGGGHVVEIQEEPFG